MDGVVDLTFEAHGDSEARGDSDNLPTVAGRGWLAAIDAVTFSQNLWIEAPLERGPVQYLNNHEPGHHRPEFKDSDDPATKRHLYRLWHRAEGGTSYDG